ncbi:hypothetical protein ACFWUW_22275 [Streptomyces sp. NPDC058655]|uniref:hypothetical protein n=1 Tax=Streptomyces sp. NPDC058655 TaxID=3346577 RepID=UPI00364E70A5
MRTHRTAMMPSTALLLLLTACGTSAPADSIEATIMCEKFAEQRLKSPGSAKFSSTGETSVTTISSTSPWKYQVVGHVDSQNSFGALVRNTYDCTAVTADGETWNLDNMTMSKN